MDLVEVRALFCGLLAVKTKLIREGAFSLYTALATTDGALFQYWVYTATERSDRSQV